VLSAATVGTTTVKRFLRVGEHFMVDLVAGHRPLDMIASWLRAYSHNAPGIDVAADEPAQDSALWR